MNKTRYFYSILLLLIVCTLFLYCINNYQLLKKKEGLTPSPTTTTQPLCTQIPTDTSTPRYVNNPAIVAAIASLQTQLSNIINSPNSTNSIWPIQFVIDVTTTNASYIIGAHKKHINLPTMIIQNTLASDGTPSNTLPYIYLTLVFQTPPTGETGPQGTPGTSGPTGSPGSSGPAGSPGWWKPATNSSS